MNLEVQLVWEIHLKFQLIHHMWPKKGFQHDHTYKTNIWIFLKIFLLLICHLWFFYINELMGSNHQTTKPLVFHKFFPWFFLSFNAQWVCQLKKRSWIRNIRNTKFVDSEFVVWWFGSISSLLNVWNLVDPFNITEFFSRPWKMGGSWP